MHDARRPSDSADRYPGYDVLAKWSGPSWNEKTREVISRRLAIGSEPKFFNAEEFATVTAIAARIVPQPTGRAPVPIAGLVDHKLDQRGHGRLPRAGHAARRRGVARRVEGARCRGAGRLQNALFGVGQSHCRTCCSEECRPAS